LNHIREYRTAQARAAQPGGIASGGEVKLPNLKIRRSQSRRYSESDNSRRRYQWSYGCNRITKARHDVVLVDPGPLPHPLAASTDISKAVRAAVWLPTNLHGASGTRDSDLAQMERELA